MSFGGVEVVNLVSDRELLQEIQDRYPDFELNRYLASLNVQVSERAATIFSAVTRLNHFYLYKCSDTEAFFIAEDNQPLEVIPQLGELYMCPMPGFVYSGRLDYSDTLFEELGSLAQLSSPLYREREGSRTVVKPRDYDITLHTILCACWRGVPLNMCSFRNLFACKRSDGGCLFYLE